MVHFRLTGSRVFVAAGLIQFEEFTLDCDRYELLRTGRPIKLEKAGEQGRSPGYQARDHRASLGCGCFC